jgi:hypothetical protein
MTETPVEEGDAAADDEVVDGDRRQAGGFARRAVGATRLGRGGRGGEAILEEQREALEPEARRGQLDARHRPELERDQVTLPRALLAADGKPIGLGTVEEPRQRDAHAPRRVRLAAVQRGVPRLVGLVGRQERGRVGDHPPGPARGAEDVGVDARAGLRARGGGEGRDPERVERDPPRPMRGPRAPAARAVLEGHEFEGHELEGHESGLGAPGRGAAGRGGTRRGAAGGRRRDVGAARGRGRPRGADALRPRRPSSHPGT